MAKTELKCIHCGSEKVVKMGRQANGTPRCKCKNCGRTFQTEYVSNGAKPEVKAMIKKMAAEGSGVRDTARVLGVSCNTVISVLKNQ